MAVPHERLVRKDRKILVENSKRILEGQRPIRVYFEDLGNLSKKYNLSEFFISYSGFSEKMTSFLITWKFHFY